MLLHTINNRNRHRYNRSINFNYCYLPIPLLYFIKYCPYYLPITSIFITVLTLPIDVTHYFSCLLLPITILTFSHQLTLSHKAHPPCACWQAAGCSSGRGQGPETTWAVPSHESNSQYLPCPSRTARACETPQDGRALQPPASAAPRMPPPDVSVDRLLSADRMAGKLEIEKDH